MNHQIVRFDTAALNKALVGFDTLFTDLEDRFVNQAGNTNYPPYNIVKYNDSTYEIQMAVTGFDPAEVSVEIDQNQLIIKGHRTLDEPLADAQYLHRGLSSRDFIRVFPLAEHMEVGQGRIKHGVLKIEITRIVPNPLKPRVLKITAE